VVEHPIKVSGWLREQLEETSPDLPQVMVRTSPRR
jgi:hypothetical protein